MIISRILLSVNPVAAAAQQELGGLDIAAPVLGPPRVEYIGVGFRNPVANGERQFVVVPYLRGQFLTVDADGVDRYFQFVQFFLVRFPFG